MSIELFFIWTNLNPLHPTMLCAEIWLKLAQRFWRRRILNFVNVFSLFRYYLPLEKCWALHLNKHCAKFGWNWPSDSGEEDFLISSLSFRYFVLISPWTKVGPFIWTNLSPHHLRTRCATFVNVFSLFRNYLPLKKGGALFWTNLNSLYPRMHCVKFGWKMIMWKVYDNDGQRKNFDQKSSLDPSAQVS